MIENETLPIATRIEKVSCLCGHETMELVCECYYVL